MDPYAQGDVSGLVLLLDAATALRCVEASQQLHRTRPSVVVLEAPASLPHATLVHFLGGPRERAAVLHQLGDGVAPQLDLELADLYFRPSNGATWAGCSVRSTGELRALHERAVGACDAAGVTVLSPTGDAYWPHVTLARWDELVVVPTDLAVLPLGIARSHLAAVAMGEHGTASAADGQDQAPRTA